MNLREWILPLSLAVVTTFLFQYFVSPYTQKGSQNQVQSGQSFVAPALENINKPLQLQVVYQSDEKMIHPQLQTITMKHASYVFSNKGAVLQNFSFPWQHGKETISSIASSENCFFVALDEQTPHMYELVRVENEPNKDAYVEYKTSFAGGSITKIFTLYQDTYKVGLDVAIEYNSNTVSPTSLRLFVAQPIMHPAITWDTLTGVVNSAGGQSLSEVDLSKDKNLQQYWAAPNAFGYASKFLIHALTKDVNASLQRGYYRKDGAGLTTAILETKVLDKSQHCAFEFFVGPKTVSAIDAVDNRFLSTLNYGWLAPISRPMLHALNYLNEKTGSYGWAIILLTLLIKILLLPFTLRGEKNMRKSLDMQKKLAYLQQKYKNDREALDRERAELIRKHGMPGMSGCLPMLLNIPVFIALNKVLSNAIELYGANFLWISNLSDKDPYYILPIITGLAMCAAPMGGGNDIKQGLSRYGIALVIASVTTYLASGLALFICVNTLLTVVQNRLQQK